MKVLLTGGTGKTALRIAALLHSAEVPFLVTSRSGKFPAPYEGILFDWLDESTYDAPFNGTGIDRVYLVAPPVLDMFGPMKKFIDLAVSKGVKRLVLLSGSLLLDENNPLAMDLVHKYIIGLGIDYCVLRPTWFMENFSEEKLYRTTIRNESKIYSATGKGVVPLVSVYDVAAVAYRALCDDKSHDTDHLILGPELMSYDQVAERLSTALARTITHVSLSQQEFEQFLIDKAGLPGNYAKAFAVMDVDISNGKEARTNHVVEAVTGRSPKQFKNFIEENKKIWALD